MTCFCSKVVLTVHRRRNNLSREPPPNSLCTIHTLQQFFNFFQFFKKQLYNPKQFFKFNMACKLFNNNPISLYQQIWFMFEYYHDKLNEILGGGGKCISLKIWDSATYTVIAGYMFVRHVYLASSPGQIFCLH